MRFRLHKLVSGPVGKTQHEILNIGPTRFDEDLCVAYLRGPIEFVRINDSVLVSGRVQTTTTVQCVRSLEDFEMLIAIEFKGIAYALPGAQVDEVDEADRLVADDGWLDLTEMLREEIVMAIPINPISPRYSDTALAALPDEVKLDDEDRDWLTVRWKTQNRNSQD
ncbi:MAG: DUF177 domain-containing protein [Chloroflexi bacterium]|nr:DUF177 domain-containing protein [Chloroflexota bacterium]